MKQMLASPNTLLSLCLRTHDFEEAKKIIHFYKLDSAESKEVTKTTLFYDYRVLLYQQTIIAIVSSWMYTDTNITFYIRLHFQKNYMTFVKLVPPTWVRTSINTTAILLSYIQSAY